MNLLTAKIVMVCAQIFPYVTLLEYLFFRTGWSFPIGFISIGILVFQKCRVCQTPLGDDRFTSKMEILTLKNIKMFDDCPVCHNPMFGDKETKIYQESASDQKYRIDKAIDNKRKMAWLWIALFPIMALMNVLLYVYRVEFQLEADSLMFIGFGFMTVFTLFLAIRGIAILRKLK